MSTDTVSPTVQVFQKAHQKLVMLQRVDEQLAQLLAQRRKLQEEVRMVQAEVNEEFERRIRSAEEMPARLLARIADESSRNGDRLATAVS